MGMEIVALRHQLLVYQRKDRRPDVNPADRMFYGPEPEATIPDLESLS